MILRPALLGAAVVTAIASFPVAASAQKPITVQEAFQRAKPAVVLVVAELASEVTLDCGSGPQKVTPPVYRETGTGWFLDTDGWLITNGHVVQPAHEPPRWLANQQAQRAVTSACLPQVLKRMGLRPGDAPEREEAAKRKLLDTVLPTAKVNLQPQIFVVTAKGRVKAEVKKYSPPVSDMSAKDLALLKVPGEAFPILPLADSKNAQIGDPIHIIGFPGVVLSHELLNQSAKVEASFTNGAVSGLKEDQSNNPLIQTDAPAAWGNSGGPAVDDRGNVVGVLTFVSLAPGAEGSIVQGFNFVIPSAAVVDFVRGTPVKVNAGSKFNDAWYAGLHALKTEDWTGALRRFEEADKLHPNLPDVRRKLTEARELVKNPPPKPFPWFWVAIGVTLVSMGGFGGQWLHRWNKNRYRVQPFGVVRMIEAGKAPTILDARKSDSYEQLPLKIPGSIRVVPEDLANSMAGLELDPAHPVVAYCSSPDEETSARVARELRKMGFKDVRILKGGLGAWTNAGLPIETRSDLSQVGLELYKALAGGNA
ncbi:MAG TPA: trypsin-like peptidase domain-containing protein [Candidatus Dormibacteraeota bacterium]|nr:trypsin-like peptidase domain-containing protein [Candidatus Dormibacteraeota bacterium]